MCGQPIPRSVYDNDRRTQVLALHLQGLTPLEIHRQTGMARPTVYSWIEQQGYRPHRRNNRVSEGTRYKAIAMRQQGADYPAIRQATGLSTNELRGIFRRAAEVGLLLNYERKPIRIEGEHSVVMRGLVVDLEEAG